MRIRIKARIVPQPCLYRDTCHGSCEWCKTHSYTEACVGMLQQQCESLRQNWIAAEKELQQLPIKGGDRAITLHDLAARICNSYHADDCETKCPARDYCRKGHNGMIDWLRKVME